MTIRELKALASQHKVKGYGRMTKAQLEIALADLDGLSSQEAFEVLEVPTLEEWNEVHTDDETYTKPQGEEVMNTTTTPITKEAVLEEVKVAVYTAAMCSLKGWQWAAIYTYNHREDIAATILNALVLMCLLTVEAGDRARQVVRNRRTIRNIVQATVADTVETVVTTPHTAKRWAMGLARKVYWYVYKAVHSFAFENIYWVYGPKHFVLYCSTHYLLIHTAPKLTVRLR